MLSIFILWFLFKLLLGYVCCRTKRKEISLTIAHQVTQTSIPPRELVCYEKETQTSTELADKEGTRC